MDETAESLEAEIIALRRNLDDKRQHLVNKENALKHINAKLDANKASKDTWSTVDARKKREEVKSLVKAICERKNTIAKERQEIEDKHRALRALNDRLEAAKLKQATSARLSQFPHKKFRHAKLNNFPHKKFRHSGYQGIAELERTLKTKEAYLRSLKGQLEELELENAREVNKVEDASHENVFNQDPVKLVFSTAEIWKNIFGQLDKKSQKTSRLVSTSWNKRALQIFCDSFRGESGECDDVCELWTNGESTNEALRYLRFRLRNLPETSNSESETETDPPFPAYDPNQGTEIIFHYHVWKRTQLSHLPTSEFLIICSQLSTQIRIMDLHLTPELASTLFNEMINKGAFPGLESFTISLDQNGDFTKKGRNGLQAERLEPRKNLSKIVVSSTHSSKTFQRWLQALVDLAPNLKKLEISGYFCPNLSKDNKLEELRIYHHNWLAFDLKRLSLLLAQVKDSIQILELEGPNWSKSEPTPFRYPVMKALKKLVVKNIGLRSLGQNGRFFISKIVKKFPILQHLSIYDFKENDLQSLLIGGRKNPKRCHLELQNLEIGNVRDPSLLRHFPTWFPNLKKLSLWSSGGPKDKAIGAELSRLKGLQLKELRLSIMYPFTLSQMVTGLVPNSDLFIGIEKFEITDQGYSFGPSPVSAVDDLNTKVLAVNKDNARATLRATFLRLLCAWLESTTINMEEVIFRDFTFSATTTEELGSLIRQKELPVKIMDSFSESPSQFVR